MCEAASSALDWSEAWRIHYQSTIDAAPNPLCASISVANATMPRPTPSMSPHPVYPMCSKETPQGQDNKRRTSRTSSRQHPLHAADEIEDHLCDQLCCCGRRPTSHTPSPLESQEMLSLRTQGTSGSTAQQGPPLAQV